MKEREREKERKIERKINKVIYLSMTLKNFFREKERDREIY